MTNSKIDEWYKYALLNGAIGGKLVGAEVGFLMFWLQMLKSYVQQCKKSTWKK